MGKGHAPASTHSVYGAVRAWLRWLAKEELIPASPTDKVPAPRTPQKAKDIHSPGQLRAILKALEGNRTPLGLRNMALVSVLIDTGCRRGELLAATLDDVDDGALLLRQTKAKRPRVAPVGEKAQRALSAYLRRGRPSLKPKGKALWLSHDGAPFTDVGLRMMLLRLSGHLGFAVTAHKFRHTWATMMLRRGVDLETLRRLGGWADYTMLRTYAHLTTDDLREAHRRASPLDRL
jgi:site-specific recombinase XerD